MTRTALVIGASSGIGSAVVSSLAQDGWSVIAAARRALELEHLATRHAPHVRALTVDVTDPDGLRDAITGCGALQLLVYAAGVNVPNREMSRLTQQDWDEIVAVNLTGAFTAISSFAPVARRDGGGRVILIGSVSAVQPDASGAAYQASKRGLAGLAHATTAEWQQDGLTVSLIQPGLVDTELLDRRREPPSQEQRKLALRPEDVASAVAFLAGMPPHVYVPELVILPTPLQAMGRT